MKKIKIRKRSGGYREIYVPSREEKVILRAYLESLSERKLSDCAHGFARGRGVVTNAERHVGKKVTISLDLKDFFDTCNIEKLKHKVSKEVLETCLVEGAARQGLPTSPALANIAFQECDEKIIAFLKEISADIIYTRYADDISISHNIEHHCFSQMLIKKISQIISMRGFRINPKKTRIQYSSRGKRELCGIFTDGEKISVSRKYKRKLRAAKHQLKFLTDEKEIRKQKQRISGMEQFMLLKKPLSQTEKEKRQKEFSFRESKQIASKEKLKNFPSSMPKKLIEEITEGDFEISNDPVRLITPSNFREGAWGKSSCLRYDGGQYSAGNAFWLLHPGVSVALITSKNTKKFHGVHRKGVLARCFVYTLRNGEKVYGEMYGNQYFFKHLQQSLEKRGIMYCSNYLREEVEGYIDRISPLPYLDNVSISYVKTNKGERMKVITK